MEYHAHRARSYALLPLLHCAVPAAGPVDGALLCVERIADCPLPALVREGDGAAG